MSLFSRPKPLATQQTILQAIRVQSSAYGQVIPIVYGQNRIPGKLIWYGDFTPIANTSKAASGGKGLGGGTTKTTSYTYQAAVEILLCEGNGAIQLCNVWDTKGTLLLVSTSENFTVPGAGGSYQVTNQANYLTHYGVSRADAYSVGANDFGSDGPLTLIGTQKTPMTQVGSSPGAGQFSVNNGTATFTFSAADAGKQVTITYIYSVPNSNSNGQPLQQLQLTLFTGSYKCLGSTAGLDGDRSLPRRQRRRGASHHDGSVCDAAGGQGRDRRQVRIRIRQSHKFIIYKIYT